VRRPNIVPGVSPYLNNDRSLINPAAFSIPLPGTFGDLPRNALRGPNFRQFDLVLFWSLDRFSREGVLETLQHLSERGELPPTIILTTFDDDQLVLAGIKAGARGYLLKDVSLDQLVDAVKAVADGGSLVAPVVTQRLLAGLERMHNDFTSLDRPDPLTERETEILRLMAGGYSNKEIANSLGVAEGTVKNHVSNILSKLGVRDRTRAVLKAFELKLV